jgi:probable rRNA maturation factor
MALLNSPNIHFHFLVNFTLRNRRALKSYIEGILKKEGKKLESINYIFCSDEYLLDINRRFLEHDYYTDIITFNLSDKGQPVNAEIYISADRVKDNAARLGVSFTEEILRVMFHGVLHLCGYKDKSKMQQQEMRAKEDYYLRRYLKKR